MFKIISMDGWRVEGHEDMFSLSVYSVNGNGNERYYIKFNDETVGTCTNKNQATKIIDYINREHRIYCLNKDRCPYQEVDLSKRGWETTQKGYDTLITETAEESEELVR